MIFDQATKKMIERIQELNPKDFPPGSVVYFTEQKGFKKRIKFGTVIEHYTGEVAIQLYKPAERRSIRGIPVNDFVTPTQWEKLPKGWSHDTVLFEVELEPLPPELVKFRIDIPELIAEAIEKGWLVEAHKIDTATFEAEIDKRYGWRIVRRYGFEYESTYCTVPFYRVYRTYAEAQQEIDEYEAELNRQASMSDFEWSIEQMDRTLDLWQRNYSITEEDKQAMRDRIMHFDRLEDVEIRIANGKIEWKYDRNKRWMAIV